MNPPCRRPPLTKTTSPNTLMVQIPYPGQSMPNLSADSSAGAGACAGGKQQSDSSSGVATPTSKRPRSPVSHRGVTYPPASPKGLRRGVAVGQQQQQQLQGRLPTLAVAAATQQQSETGGGGQTIPVITGEADPPNKTCV